MQTVSPARNARANEKPAFMSFSFSSSSGEDATPWSRGDDTCRSGWPPAGPSKSRTLTAEEPDRIGIVPSSKTLSSSTPRNSLTVCSTNGRRTSRRVTRQMLLPVRGEVLVVDGPRPVTAPPPPARVERLPHDVAVEDHPLAPVGPIRVHRPVRRGDPAGPQFGILDGVDVDRLAVGVHRPRATHTVAVPTVERRPLVVPHRTLVVGPVAIYQPDPADREASGVELPEQPRDVARDRSMHDEPAVVRLAVEPPERDADDAEVVQPDGAPGPPRRSAHQSADRCRKGSNARAVWRRRGGDRSGGNEDECQGQ